MCQYAFLLTLDSESFWKWFVFFLLHPIALPGRIRIPATKYSATCFDLSFKFESSSEEFRRAPFCWQLRMSILLKSRSDDDRKGLLSVCPPAPLFQIVLCASLPVFQSSSALLPNSTSVHPAPVASWLCLQIKQTKMFRWLSIGEEAMCHHFL